MTVRLVGTNGLLSERLISVSESMNYSGMKNKILLLCFLVAGTAWAQSFEGAVSGGVSQISNGDLGSGYSLDDGFRLTFRMTFNPHDLVGYELGYAYNRTHLQGTGMAIHQGFGDVLLHATRAGSRIRPFVAGGLNFSNFVPPGATAQYGQGENKFGFNYGGGIKWKVAGPWQVRFDIRQFNTGKPFSLGGSGRLLQNEISVGVGWTM